MSDTFEELYEKYEILSGAKQQISEKSLEYLACVRGTKGTAQEKKLAAQILAKFFKHFPHHQDQALNAILDLCEDSDSDIRMCAMKFLPVICKETKENVTNIASILSQLLQLEGADYTVASNCLTQVFKIDPLNAIKGIFNNLHAMDEEGLREKILQFLFDKLIKAGDHKETKEIQDVLINESRKIIAHDCTGDEFMTLMTFLMSTQWAKGQEGKEEICNLISQKIDISEAFNLEDVDRLILCVDLAMPLLKTYDSTQYVSYYCQKVLPKLDELPTAQLQIKLLRQLALMSANCKQATLPTMSALYECLKRFVPTPPDDVDLSKSPDLEFSIIECLLYAFHKLARHLPEFLVGNELRLKDFRSRLQYLARGVQGCKRGSDQKINQRILDNLNALIKDLFHQTPLFKVNVQLSFAVATVKNTVEEANPQSPLKRRHNHTPITFDSTNGNEAPKKQTRTNADRQLYRPPSGKFSNSFGGRGRGWGRGQSNRTNSNNWRN